MILTLQEAIHLAAREYSGSDDCRPIERKMLEIIQPLFVAAERRAATAEEEASEILKRASGCGDSLREIELKLLRSEQAAATAYADGLSAVIHICEFAANGTIEEMSREGHSETWKIIAENSVEQYRSIVKGIRELALKSAELKKMEGEHV